MRNANYPDEPTRTRSPAGMEWSKSRSCWVRPGTDGWLVDEIVSGQCVGAVRLCAIDMGFDPRAVGTAADISGVDGRLLTGETESVQFPGDHAGVGYDGRDGRRHLMRGTRDEISRVLAANGYMVIAARTPNGRDVRCEPKNPAVFVCQAPHDNYWIEYPSIAAALASFE